MSTPSQSISDILADQGYKLTAAAVRKHWRESNAPRDAKEFCEWYITTIAKPREDAKDAKQTKLLKEIERLELINAALRDEAEIRRRDLIPKAEISEAVKSAVARIKGMLTASFVTELPARQSGRPADEISAMNEAEINRIMGELYGIAK